MSPSIAKLKNLLKDSELLEADSASNAIEAGWTVEVSPRTIPCVHLLRIYEICQKHLASLPGEHASRLAHSVLEFVDRLNAHTTDSVYIARIQGDAEHHFGVFCLIETDEPIACLRTVSKLEVTPNGGLKSGLEICTLDGAFQLEQHRIGRRILNPIRLFARLQPTAAETHP